MYINNLYFLVLTSTWQITPTTFPLKKRTGEWSQNGEKAVLSPPYNTTRWQRRHAAARYGAPRFSASNDRGGRGGRRFSCWKCVSQPTFLWPGNPVTQFLIMLLSEPLSLRFVVLRSWKIKMDLWRSSLETNSGQFLWKILLKCHLTITSVPRLVIIQSQQND